ncbi:MAG: adenylate/guanylate cyclase domain-containing protein [Methylophilales bacterium]|nr:adenylate/guanylate cyclase domain-containing protein [Methylophilales bacterium]
MERHLATVLCADVKDYSRHMGSNEEATIRRLHACRAVFDALIVEHGGRIANTAGDSVVSEFSSVSNAVTCAVRIQEKLIALDAGQGEGRLVYRLGIHLGEVIAKGEDILGDTVNIAARLEGIAEADGICISASVYDAVRNKLPYQYESLGEKSLKNIDEPIKVFSVLREGQSAAQPEQSFPTLPDKPSIAVLPLDNMSNDPEQEYFSDGLTEDIITDLSKVSGLFVIARNSTFVYKKQSVDLRRVGAELGVKYVLEGSVRKGGDRVRITVQLIEAATGSHVWAERYDRVLTDIFDVQDEMTRTIVEALEVKLTKKEQTLLAIKETESVEAYDLLIQARELYYRFSKDGVTEGRQIALKAIKIDPNYAIAYTLASHTHIYDYIAGYVPYSLENLELALPLVKKAIEIDQNCARAYAALGWYHIWHGQPAEGITQLHKGIALEPGFDYAHSWLSYGYSAMEQGEEALKYAKEALRLNPHNHVVPYHAMGCAYFALDDLEEGIKSDLRSIAQNPHFLPAHLFIAASNEMLGRRQEAERHAQEIRRLSPNFTVGVCNLYSPETKSYKRLNEAIAALGFPKN